MVYRGPSSSGSSPRMRGAQSSAFGMSKYGRIIPADAGSTRPDELKAIKQGDHPRGCGEHRISVFVHMVYSGSSPRMRGAP